MSAARVGFIGLGSQGGPMARRIVESGFPLTLWARRPESTEAFAGTEARIAATPAELGRDSDIVGICVVADADVEDVLLRPDGVLAGLQPGSIVMVHSTIHPETCRRLGQATADRGVELLDAPVSGGGIGAAERRLLVMAGGEPTTLAKCRPVLETFAGSIVHLGGVGAGQVAKVVNNLVFTAQIAVALDTFAFGESLGVEKAALAEVLLAGSGGSRFAAILAASGFSTVGLTQHAPLLRKDVDIALDAGADRGAPRPEVLADLAERALRMLGNGDHQDGGPAS